MLKQEWAFLIFILSIQAWAQDARVSSPVANTLVLETNSTEKVRVDSAGNMGIGTSSPSRLLHVNGPMRLTPAALPGTPGAGDLVFDSGAANALKYYNGSAWVSVGGGGTGDFLANGTVPMTGNFQLGGQWLSNDGGSEGIRVDNSGNVGVGTATPGALFTVQKSNNSATEVQISALGISGNQETFLSFVTKSNNSWLGQAANKGWQFGARGDAYTTAAQQNDFMLSYWNGSTYLNPWTIDSLTGNMGINNTSPGSTFDVKGTLRLSGSTSGYVGFAPASAAGSVTYTLPTADGSAGYVLKTSGAGVLSWGAASSVPISLTANRLIGTGVSGTAMSEVSCSLNQIISFDASGNWTCASLSGFVDGGNTFTATATLGTNSNHDLAFETNGTTKMTVKTDGKVGIGISPTDLLQVAGTMNSLAGLTLYNGNGGTSAATVTQYFNDDASGAIGVFPANSSNVAYADRMVMTTNADAAGMTFNTPGTQDVRFRLNGTEAMRILSSGYVGIGTTNPTVPLEVVGGSAYFTRSQNDAWGSNFLVRKNRAGAIVQNGDEIGYVNFAAYDGAAYRTGASVAAVVDGVPGSNDMPTRLIFTTTPDGSGTNSERMRIDSAGNVGIGITAPSHILHINGQGRATNTAWATTSDIRLKDIEGRYQYGLNEILKMNTVWFRYKKNNPIGLPSDQSFPGVIAQEIKEIIPEAVRLENDGYYTLNVDPIHWASVNAIKELSAQLEESKKENAELKARLDAIESKLKEK